MRKLLRKFRQYTNLNSSPSNLRSWLIVLNGLTKVIPHAFGERAVLKLMYAALIRAA